MMYNQHYSKALALHADPSELQAQQEVKGQQKAINRRTVDFSGPALKFLGSVCCVRNRGEGRALQPTAAGALDMMIPAAYPHMPGNCFSSKFIHVSTNKVRCAINVVLWMPDGRRLMTGTHSGEFTLWNGTCFNFETIIQAHETPIRTMQWAHNENFFVSGDDGGSIKYWKPNMENVKVKKAHNEAVRGISFAPSDLKFATASDDSIVKVWDFGRCTVTTNLTGHGGDVKSVDWHPRQALLASGSKDGLVKLWDPKTNGALTSLHGHKGIVTQARWNKNGNWLLTASRDQLLKIYDIRTMKEMASFKGHSKDVSCCAWHPFHEELFASGAYDGSLIYWTVGQEKPQAEVRNAHDMHIWSMDWHPLGHMLCTGSNDYSTKFWGRSRPGDIWRDRRQEEQEALERSESGLERTFNRSTSGSASVPGLDSIPGIGGNETEVPMIGSGGPGLPAGMPPPSVSPGGLRGGPPGLQPPIGRGSMHAPGPGPPQGGRGRGNFRGSVMRSHKAPAGPQPPPGDPPPGMPPPPGIGQPPQGMGPRPPFGMPPDGPPRGPGGPGPPPGMPPPRPEGFPGVGGPPGGPPQGPMTPGGPPPPPRMHHGGPAPLGGPGPPPPSGGAPPPHGPRPPPMWGPPEGPPQHPMDQQHMGRPPPGHGGQPAPHGGFGAPPGTMHNPRRGPPPPRPPQGPGGGGGWGMQHPPEGMPPQGPPSHGMAPRPPPGGQWGDRQGRGGPQRHGQQVNKSQQQQRHRPY